MRTLTPRALLRLALIVALPAQACEVPVERLLGDYQYVTGPTDIQDVSLSEAQGDRSFNATLKWGDMLVGGWRFEGCRLTLVPGMRAETSGEESELAFRVIDHDGDRLRLAAGRGRAPSTYVRVGAPR